MVKSYLRYEHKDVFGLVSSPKCKSIVYDKSGRFAIVGALGKKKKNLEK